MNLVFNKRKKLKNMQMKKLMWAMMLSISSMAAYSQTYITRNGYIGFFSKTPLEDIKAENRQVYAVIDAGKKNLAFTCLVKGFLFQKELMQEHFNENYIESDKYPKADFLGAYTGDVNTTKDGIYPVQVKGQLTLHGVTQTIEAPAKIEIKGNKLIGTAELKLTPGDFNIQIPALVREKIAKQMDVHISVETNPK
jgi:hypothetical protein